MKGTLSLGVDIGGTGVKLALVDGRGRIRRLQKFASPTKESPTEFLNIVGRWIRRFVGDRHLKTLRGIGLGVAGDVDHVHGRVRISPNLQWRNIPVKTLLRRYLPSIPFIIENDANAAAWAAYWVETHQRAKNLVCLTLGRGVGGGLVLNGVLYRGATGSAGEIGHMTIDLNGPACPCGSRGCIERYVGARALVERVRQAIEDGEQSLVTELVGNNFQAVTPLVIQQAAQRGDRLAQRIWREAGERLGVALASVVNLFNPERIILAGGVARAGRLILDPARRVMRQRAFPVPGHTVRVSLSQLDQDLGVVGAALLVP
ncbi:MAG: ROK family protein [Elusimicrobia bacterium]|nr:ROK family protein [Elusimicrobiota bacterium]